MGCWLIWYKDGTKRNVNVSIATGALFALGWWLIIDAASTHPGKILFKHHMCGIGGTLGLYLVNRTSRSAILESTKTKTLVYIGLCMGFVTLFGSCAILIINFISSDSPWPGIALFLQNFLICISSCIFRFMRSDDSEEETRPLVQPRARSARTNRSSSNYSRRPPGVGVAGMAA